MVVGDDVGGRFGDRLVDRDDDDACFRRFLERRLDAGRIGRVDDNGVDSGADQVAQVFELAGSGPTNPHSRTPVHLQRCGQLCPVVRRVLEAEQAAQRALAGATEAVAPRRSREYYRTLAPPV